MHSDPCFPRTVTGAILAPHETQRLVVSGKTGHHHLRYASETGLCVPIDPGGEMVTRVFDELK